MQSVALDQQIVQYKCVRNRHTFVSHFRDVNLLGNAYHCDLISIMNH